MEKFAGWILRRRVPIFIVFVIAVALCVILSQGVQVNYLLSDYLPDDAPSTVALHVMGNEYADGIANVRFCVSVSGIPEALEYKTKLEALDFVNSVTWLDDVYDVTEPLESFDRTTVESYYKDGYALFSLNADDGDATTSLTELQELAGKSGMVSGDLVNIAASQRSVKSEIARIIIIIVPAGVLILIFALNSFVEPFLLLISIGAAIALNAGTTSFSAKFRLSLSRFRRCCSSRYQWTMRYSCSSGSLNTAPKGTTNLKRCGRPSPNRRSRSYRAR